MYIARQPIFDRAMKVYGYELLFRSDEKAVAYGSTTAEQSTATVLGGLFELGLEQLVGNKKAFVNFDYQFLLSDSIELISAETLVIEVLENTVVDEVLLERLKKLKKAGYTIALDDFEESLQAYPIVPIADIIKYDILLTPLDSIRQDVKEALSQHKYILAEKIESEEEFQKAKEMGFHFFQGFFFSKPKIVGGLKAAKTANTIYQRIIGELHKEEPSYKKIAEIIETDVNLAYRVMKASTLRHKVDANKTILIALTKMGLTELERWMNILMLQELSNKKPLELVRLSLVRSKFGELIAINSSFKKRRYEISLMSLFSVLDAIMDLPMEMALQGLSLSDDVKEVLIHCEGDLKPICHMMTAYEKGDWQRTNELAEEIKLDPSKLMKLYLEAVTWANDTMKTIG